MNTKTPIFHTSLLYICAFILFMEWLYPVNQIGEVTNMTVFILYTIYCFFISLLGIKWWLSIPLKGLGLLFIIDSLYMAPAILSVTWLTQFMAEVGFNINALFSQQWYALTPLFRSMLFLVLIWMLSYLLYYWFIVMKRVFIFSLLTFIYLSLLDTFTPYEANAAIVRTFIVSFAALGLSNFSKEIGKEAIHFSWAKRAPMWAIPLVSVVLFSTLIGYAAPKLEPQWPDPVPFIQSAAENAGGPGNGGGIQKVGYGENDSQLGGSFVQDYTPVFQAAAKDEHYWRVETKDVYTGKGWEKSRDPQFEPQYDGNITLSTFANDVETEELETMLDFQENSQMEKLVYPYGIDRVEVDQSERVDLQLDPEYGEIQTQRNGNSMRLDQYTIHYNKPSFAIDELREVKPGDDPQELKDHYTQLPETLPERVSELAEDITEDEENRYDKARSIESYFGRNGFTYQISNVPVPEEEQDYVDQFLFESQAGYCDNYSTSMVVMLRSLDIPARWAKGFTSGEVIQSGDTPDDYDIYEVTNANAHSWVEVYFPGEGWVPFEPTQGFSNLTDFHMNMDETDEEGALEPEEDDAAQGQQEEVPEEEENEAAAAQNDGNSGSFEINWWYVLIGALAAGLLVWLIYRTRFRWRTAYISRKLQRRQDAKTFQEAYHWLLSLLKQKEFGKAPGQTLREYAKQVDFHYDTYTMNHLTNYYERMLYNNETNTMDINQVNESWKNLIKKIMA
ncbi:Transglutaminase-like superfamily protein [Lentibacillus persicus]|uniref:Transglutaminase-like superfamily protein n=1 Tax=Lentibacillus persicus TaxID=640948 RepID=A0A1I1Z3Y2_9BACI|nr:transglutaminase domain-containing protein [Lentibacillus persicus]SFE25173.1 Transglutaminase-like superfamily protein [Lentibacillus persicus]